MPPRLLRPKDEPGVLDGTDPAVDSTTSKRRAVSSACIPCRKRKSKCDGALPSCSTCTAVYRTECAYDADSDHRRKGALRRDIQSLQQQNDALDVIVASLQTLPETEAIALLHNLRGDSTPDILAASLRTNVRLPHSYAPQTLEADLVEQISHPVPSSSPSNDGVDATPRSRDRSRHGHPAGTTSGDNPMVWFNTPQDPEFVEHLLKLYFAWIQPFYHFLSPDLFLPDMARGRTDFCSTMLVNAMLAFACHYSDRPQARPDPSNPSSVGDQFFVEAKRILDLNEKSCLTTVQALGIMAARECSHGRDANGYKLAGMCVRMALELGLHLSHIGSGLRPADVEARKITFWGVFNLETICSVGFGRLSQLPRAAADIQKPSVHERSDSSTWKPYVDTNLALSPSVEQPSQPLLFVDQLSRLCELASDMVNTFYAPQERFTSRRLAVAYQQYQEWYQNLPPAFRLENSSLPHVIVLHMYYYACVLHLFRPYIKLDLRGAGLYPRDTCTFCANEISALMTALRAMYGLRRVALAVTSVLLSASTIHLLNLPAESAAAHLTQGMHDLQAVSINHQFAAKCIDIIRVLATKWNIVLPEGATAVSVFRERWPSPPSSAFFAASIPRKDSSAGGARSGDSGLSQGPFGPPNDTPVQQQQPHQQPPPPPPQQQHQQQKHPEHFPAFYNDPAAPMDAHQTQQQMAFWTPFPVQGAPSQHHHHHHQSWQNGIPLDFTPHTDSNQQQQHWPPLYDGCGTGGLSSAALSAGGPPGMPLPAVSSAAMDVGGTGMDGMGAGMAWDWG